MVDVLREREIRNLDVRELVFFSFLSGRYKKHDIWFECSDFTEKDAKRPIGVTKIATICGLTSGGMAKAVGFLAGVPFPSSSRRVLYYFSLSF